MQAAIGASIIGFFIGNERGKRVTLEKSEKLKAVQTKAIKNEPEEQGKRKTCDPMFAIDEIAYASPFRDWSPLGKFALALSLLVSSLVASSIAIPILVFLIGFGLLFYSTRMRFPRVIVLALLDGLVIFFIGAVVIALVTTGRRFGPLTSASSC